MKSIVITLGDREYEIKELTTRKNAAWRVQLQEPFGNLVQMLQDAPTTELNNLRDVGSLVQSMSGLLLGSIDTVIGMVFAYSPVLAADRDYIENEAFDSQLLEAFTGVLGLAYPISTWAGKAAGLARELNAIGSQSPETSTSSVSVNGDSGQTRLTPQR